VVKSGLRLQILLLLGGLLLVAFVPLHFAVTTYSEVALRQQRDASVRQLGRAIAVRISEARSRRSVSELMNLLKDEMKASNAEALAIYDRNGAALVRIGDVEVVTQLGAENHRDTDRSYELQSSHGQALAIAVADEDGSVWTVLRTDRNATRVGPLVNALGLYMGLIALALLVLSYFALTRLIVRPLDALSRAAERVAGGARQLEVPRRGPQELIELGLSLKTMTERLLSEEEKLRHKVDEVERATEGLKLAQDHLVRSERLASVGRLAAGLAHEVGNPIAAIMGIQDLLLQTELSSGERQDFLERMRGETERIHRILRDLLQFARPGSISAQEVPMVPGDVETAVTDTVALIEPQESMKRVTLEVDIERHLPPVALGREQLVQIVLNLLLNAGDACNTVTSGVVRIRARSQEDKVVLEIEDTGPGVDPKVVERLFEPFVTTKEVGRGTGLGLAVCRGLVDAVGGSIVLDRNYAKGARFAVTVPAVRKNQ
jgi:signal transduction histidine kinase